MIVETLMMISFMMVMIMFIMKFNKKNKKNNLLPFECGFSSLKFKTCLSIQFSLISFIFIIFDIELSILMMANYHYVNKEWIMAMILFMISMIISVMYELLKNSMQWIK